MCATYKHLAKFGGIIINIYALWIQFCQIQKNSTRSEKIVAFTRTTQFKSFASAQKFLTANSKVRKYLGTNIPVKYKRYV